MELFANFQFVQDIARQLIQPRPCSYMALDIWKHISNRQLYQYEHSQFQIPGERTISLHLIQNTTVKNGQQSGPSTCIVYLHGLSSFSVEGNFLVESLENKFSGLNISVCLYDLRGHGKDKAQNITFGLQQSKQLYQILLFLKKQKQYKQFVLWGRSMGATTILKMLNDLYQSIQENQIQIKYLILDSAFSSIEKVATEIISKKSRVPQIFCKPVFQYLISTVEKLHKIKLTMDISNIRSFDVNALFLYSEIDNLVSAEHSKILFNKYTGAKDKIQMNVGHNDQRPDHVLNLVFERLRKCLKFESTIKKRNSFTQKKIGLSVTKSKRVQTHQSAFDRAESYITQDFQELKTEESNKENVRDIANKSHQYSVHKSQILCDHTKKFGNKNETKMSPKIYKIAKDQNIKQMKLTKKFISLNGNMRNSVHLFGEAGANSSIVKDQYQKRGQKLKLSHKEPIAFKKTNDYLQEPKQKTSIYQKTVNNNSQNQQKNSPSPYTQNLNQHRFKQVKSSFLIRNSDQTIRNISPDMKQGQVKINFDQNQLINKKLSFNQNSYEITSNCFNRNINHVTLPTSKPQSPNLNLTQKRVSNLPNKNNSQKELTNEIKLGPKKHLADIRKSIDLQLLKIEKMSPIYQSCVVSGNVTPQNSSQKVIFNFHSNDQNKINSIHRLSNQYYM